MALKADGIMSTHGNNQIDYQPTNSQAQINAHFDQRLVRRYQY